MSTSLPQEVKTSKVETLPDDLKKIAEKMLSKKFGVEEVAEYDIPDPFHWQPGGTIQFPQSVAYVDDRREVARGVYQDVDFRTRRYIYHTEIHEPTLRAFYDALRRLDHGNVPREDRRAIVGRRFLEELRMQPHFEEAARHRMNDRFRGTGDIYAVDIMNIPVLIREGVLAEIQVRI